MAPSYGSDQTLLWAAGGHGGLGFDFVKPEWIPFRGELSWYAVGPSTWDDSLFRYRSFNGFRMAAMSGLRFDLKGSELDILGGAAASALGYTGISEATAYLSILAEARYILPLRLSAAAKLKLVAALPVEYMFRGTARTIAAGLDLGIGIDLPAATGAAK